MRNKLGYFIKDFHLNNITKQELIKAILENNPKIQKDIEKKIITIDIPTAELNSNNK